MLQVKLEVKWNLQLVCVVPNSPSVNISSSLDRITSSQYALMSKDIHVLQRIYKGLKLAQPKGSSPNSLVHLLKWNLLFQEEVLVIWSQA